MMWPVKKQVRTPAASYGKHVPVKQAPVGKNAPMPAMSGEMMDGCQKCGMDKVK